jgi:hypothetical protein
MILAGGVGGRRWESRRAFVLDWTLLRRGDPAAARLQLDRERGGPSGRSATSRRRFPLRRPIQPKRANSHQIQVNRAKSALDSGWRFPKRRSRYSLCPARTDTALVRARPWALRYDSMPSLHPTKPAATNGRPSALLETSSVAATLACVAVPGRTHSTLLIRRPVFGGRGRFWIPSEAFTSWKLVGCPILRLSRWSRVLWSVVRRTVMLQGVAPYVAEMLHLKTLIINRVAGVAGFQTISTCKSHLKSLNINVIVVFFAGFSSLSSLHTPIPWAGTGGKAELGRRMTALCGGRMEDGERAPVRISDSRPFASIRGWNYFAPQRTQ